VANEPEISAFTDRRIAGLVESALIKADVAGQFPTPLGAVGEAAGLLEVVDMQQLPEAVAAKKPARLKRVLGAIMFAERVVFVDRSEPTARQRFTEGHEITHQLIPWHEDTFLLDGKEELDPGTKEKLEAEANLGSSRILFQNGRFHEIAADSQAGMSAALDTAMLFEASGHAALRYYVEHHPTAAMGLLVAGRMTKHDGTLPIWHSIASPEFRTRFGDLAAKLPAGVLATSGRNAIFGEIIHVAWTSSTPSAKPVSIPNFDGDSSPFVAEAWFNQHCMFVLVTEKSARRLGRRIKLAS